MPLFQLRDTTLHSGRRSTWKIDCDALTDDDLACLAHMIAGIMSPFGSVDGVPRGGLRIASWLEPYRTDGPLLIVDDVLTTGGSMEDHRAGRDAIGCVLFARGPCPLWVAPLFHAHRRAW